MSCAHDTRFKALLFFITVRMTSPQCHTSPFGVFDGRGISLSSRFCSIPRFLEKHGHTELLYLDDDFSRNFILGSFFLAERRRSGEFTMPFSFSHFAVVGAFLQLDTFWFKRTLVVAGSIYNFQ